MLLVNLETLSRVRIKISPVIGKNTHNAKEEHNNFFLKAKSRALYSCNSETRLFVDRRSRTVVTGSDSL